MADGIFTPALIVVDMQEDFCPPSGSLAVASARSLAPTINDLLSLPFALRIATKDAHPPDHISFAASHPPPDNIPFESVTTLSNHMNAIEDDKKEIPLWPTHCVAGTSGAALIPELDLEKIDLQVEKGRETETEMFSAFADIFGNKSTAATNVDLGRLLKERRVTHVYTVGVAGDYCVKCTALDAKKEGMEVYVIQEGVRSVDAGKGWNEARKEMEGAGVGIVSIDGAEVERVRRMK